MRYAGRHTILDFSLIKTYPLAQRPNVLTLQDVVDPATVAGAGDRWPNDALRHLTDAIREARSRDLPVIFFTGAHIIKLGLSRLVTDLMQRGIITLLATTGAGSIHDLELALIGETSESVPNALPEGLFGMAEETGRYLNEALCVGDQQLLGYGESVGRMVVTGEPVGAVFPHRDISILGRAYELGLPATVHVTIGADIIDQHPCFDGRAKGGASGRDFGIFANEVTKLAGGGVVLNVGSAVTGPEVLLKAVSIAANVGKPPTGIVTGNLDLRAATPEDTDDPEQAKYYYRDVKSTVTRIPRAFGGRGYMVQGHFRDSIPALYDMLTS